jgi:hypothetical protein
MLLVCLAILFASPFVLAMLFFLVPGRKGKMRTERRVAHDALAPEQARSLYAARLAYDGFAIDPATAPAVLRATRAGAASGETHTHADKPMVVEMRFDPAGGGVRVHLVAWLKDFVFYDTGESRLLDLTLDRILNAELAREAPPLVPNYSFMAMSCLTSAAIGVATIGVVVFQTKSAHIRLAGLVAGAALACVGSLFLARETLAQIRRRPDELKGVGILIATAVVGTAGIVAGAVVLWVRFRETLMHAFRQYLP